MTWASITPIAELIGAIVLIISLVYLAIQVRQSNKIAIAEAERDILENWMRGLEGLVDSDHMTGIFLRGLADFEALSSIEKTRWSYRLTQLNMVYISAIQNEKKGLIDSDLVEACGDVFFSYVNSPGGRQWWEVTGRFFPQNFDQINRRLETEGDTFPSFLDSLPYHRIESER